MKRIHAHGLRHVHRVSGKRMAGGPAGTSVLETQKHEHEWLETESGLEMRLWESSWAS